MVGPDDRPDPDHELLHREIDRLPASYRRVVLLCDLSGHSHTEAASLLGWPLGTVKGRHFRARELLRSRLARLGLAVSAVTLAQAGARASVPAGLAARVAQAATRISCTGAAWLGVSAIPAERLMKGVLVAMFFQKIKLGAAVLVPAAVLGLATMAGAARWQGQEGARQDEPATATADATQRKESPQLNLNEPSPNRSRDELIRSLSGRWDVASVENNSDAAFSERSLILRAAPDWMEALVNIDGVPFLVEAVFREEGGEMIDGSGLAIARKGKDHGQLDVYTTSSFIKEKGNGTPVPESVFIFQQEGDTLRMACNLTKVRPDTFSRVGGSPSFVITYKRAPTRAQPEQGFVEENPAEGIPSNAREARADEPSSETLKSEPNSEPPNQQGEAITNPLVGLWELESVDGRAMPAGIYLKMLPSPVLPTSEEDRDSTWLVLKSISVGNNLPYAYADQFVAVGGGEEKRGFNRYTPGSLANAKGPSPATRGEYQLEEGGKLTIATVLTAPRTGAVEAGGGPLREVRVYRRVEGGNPKVEEAEGRAEVLPGAGNPIKTDPIERKEAAVGEMVRTHQSIQEIRSQLKQLHETTAENTVDAEYTSFRVELIKEEIREGYADLRRLENRSPAELEKLSQAEAIVMKNLKYRMDAQDKSLSRLLKHVAEAKSKVEQSKQDIERLNEELDALYLDRKAAGDTLESP
jgi:hypothetical protein